MHRARTPASRADARAIGKVDGEWRCGKHGGKPESVDAEIISVHEAEHIEQVRRAVFMHKGSALFRSDVGGDDGRMSEVTLIWDCMGYDAKARLDKYIPATRNRPATIVDVKKVRSGHGNVERFGKAVHRYKYHWSGAFYSDAVKQLTGDDRDPRFYFVVVEDAPPYAVGVYELSGTDINIGRQCYRNVIHRMKQCEQSNHWPGYSTSVETVELPGWYVKQFERDHLIEEVA